WMRTPFQADASHRKSGAAAQAKSRTFLAVRCQVLAPGVRCALYAVASALVMTCTRSAEVFARVSRARSVALHTANGFRTVPGAAARRDAPSPIVRAAGPGGGLQGARSGSRR